MSGHTNCVVWIADAIDILIQKYKLKLQFFYFHFAKKLCGRSVM